MPTSWGKAMGTWGAHSERGWVEHELLLLLLVIS